MALIEGVGDEVTILFALVLLFSVVILAWISTHTAERSPTHCSSPSYGARNSPGSNDPPSSTDRPPTDHDPDHSGDNETLTDRGTPVVSGPQPPLSTDSFSEEPSSSADSTSHDTLRHRGPHTQTEGAPTDAQEITLRLKFLNDTEQAMTVRLSDTVMHIKRIQFPGQESRVRLIYQGQLLRDDSQTVASLQLTDGCVLHCHISQHASSPGHGRAELEQIPLNIGSLMVPLFGLILVILWYCQLQYPHVFTGTATTCLSAITLLATIIGFSSYRR